MQLEKIIEKYNETKSLRETAKFFNTTSFKIKKVLKAGNFELKTKLRIGKILRYDIEAVKNRIAQGETTKAIATSLGINVFSLRSMLSREKKKHKTNKIACI